MGALRLRRWTATGRRSGIAGSPSTQHGACCPVWALLPGRCPHRRYFHWRSRTGKGFDRLTDAARDRSLVALPHRSPMNGKGIDLVPLKYLQQGVKLIGRFVAYPGLDSEAPLMVWRSSRNTVYLCGFAAVRPRHPAANHRASKVEINSGHRVLFQFPALREAGISRRSSGEDGLASRVFIDTAQDIGFEFA